MKDGFVVDSDGDYGDYSMDDSSDDANVSTDDDSNENDKNDKDDELILQDIGSELSEEPYDYN